MARHQVEMSDAGKRIDELTASIAEIDRLAATVDEEKAREELQIAEASARLTQAREAADAADRARDTYTCDRI